MDDATYWNSSKWRRFLRRLFDHLYKFKWQEQCPSEFSWFFVKKGRMIEVNFDLELIFYTRKGKTSYLRY